MDNEGRHPLFMEVFPDGPAGRAGVKAKDVLESVEGEPTTGQPLRSIIERLRGPLGTEVSIGIRTPPSKEIRSLTLKRGLLPRSTVGGVRKRADGGYDLCLDTPGAGTVGYVRLSEISGSTPQELRALASQMEARNARALIIDLRGTLRGSLHATVLLADALIDSGTIGRVRWIDRVETFQAEPDALFRNWPMAVLVDQTTGPEAAWLAAALQDNRHALVVGQPTSPYSGVRTAEPILGGTYSVMMATGELLRGDGRPMGTPLPLIPGPDEAKLARLLRERSARVAVENRSAERQGIKPDAIVPAPNPPDPATTPRSVTTLHEAVGSLRDPAVSLAAARLIERLATE
jgi:carboxyl-terminal processing protease